MALPAGGRLGPYQILSPVGAGGQGEVYRAKDTRLDREVAIKVLPADVAASPPARERFEREARAVAALSHPHICVLHDVGRHDGIDFLVMELLAGETLAERLARGALSLSQSLEYGVQISDALDKAHRAGIVHRDLKPANIMLTKTGAKLLDFGLAKRRALPLAGPGDSDLPTRDLTAQGSIVGTLQYMAPEQLEGKEADGRADVWALGAILYEMVTGTKAFQGKSQASLIAAILGHEPPPMESVQPLSPPLLNRLVQHCLKKDPNDRMQSAGDACQALRWISESRAEAIPARGRGNLLPWTLAGLFLFGLLSALSLFRPSRRPPDAPEVRFQIDTPPTADLLSMAVSPDGRQLVVVASAEGIPQLWLRPLDSLTAQPLAGTDGASFPFWSPDSRSIGFFADSSLKRIDLGSGLTRTLAGAMRGLGGTWNREGTILFAPSNAEPLRRVSAAGGDAVPVTRLAPQQIAHRFPQFLPDGRHFLFYTGGSEDRAVYMASLDATEPERLFEADAAALVAPGHLLFLRDRTLLAQRFDSETLELSSEPFPVAEHLVFDESVSVYAAAFSASTTGVLAYRTASADGDRQLVWFDRSGTRLAEGTATGSSTANPELSPDGRWVAFNRSIDLNMDIWLLETERGLLNRFTIDERFDHSPLWSSDGTRLVFNANRKGVFGIYQKSARGSGSEELVHAVQRSVAMDWSRDGRFLLYRALDPNNGYDLWALPISPAGGDAKPFPMAASRYDEREGQFSPDGRSIAFQSNESGRFEVYLQPFPESTGKRLVSTNGGAQPRFRADGRELFYLALDGTMMAVTLEPAAQGSIPEVGAPAALFSTRIAGGATLPRNPLKQQYDVSADGQRFLINVAAEFTASPITVILNWQPERR
jgi:serine/threonine protein kinase